MFQAAGDLRIRSGRKNVPSLGLAVGQSDRPCESIVGMDLEGQRFRRKQQLEQQCRIWRGSVYALKPQFADRFAIRRRVVPGQQIDASPRLLLDLDAR